jgi:hypothetical protein
MNFSLKLTALFVLSMAFSIADGQSSPATTSCGKAEVHMANPVYLIISDVIVAVEPPARWQLDQTRKNPFIFLKPGEKYESARTLMYVNIELLDGPFQNAVQRDSHSFELSRWRGGRCCIGGPPDF